MDECDTLAVENGGSQDAVSVAGRYRLGSLMAADRRRRVYEGWDTRLERGVTVLLVTSPARREPDLAPPTVPVAVQVHRPGLVELYDGGVDDGRLFLVTQSVPGPTLREQRGQLDVRDLAVLGAQLATALQPVHRRGAAHGALTPDLILLGGTQPMIAECGLAPAIERWSGAAADPRYRAPEQGDGVTTPAADVYALGRILAESCPGPWHGAAARQLRALTGRMTSSMPADRPAIDELAALLAASGAGSDLRPVPRPSASARRLAALALAVTAVATFGTAAASVLDHSAPTGASALVAPPEGPVPTAATAPTGPAPGHQVTSDRVDDPTAPTSIRSLASDGPLGSDPGVRATLPEGPLSASTPSGDPTVTSSPSPTSSPTSSSSSHPTSAATSSSSSSSHPTSAATSSSHPTSAATSSSSSSSSRTSSSSVGRPRVGSTG